MRMLDVNVLVYAHREDAHSEHDAYLAWLHDLAVGPEPWAVTSLALSGLVRVVTQRRIFPRPSTLDEVFAFIDALVACRSARVLDPGSAHLAIFQDLCRRTGAAGKLVADAYHAAIAIEHGCTWVTTDSDFGRFPGLRWEHPLRPVRSGTR